MKRSIRSVSSAFVALAALLTACTAPAFGPTSMPSTSAPTPIPPTSMPEPTATLTLTASSTALPGKVTIPVDTLGTSIPWLPLEKGSIPISYFFAFNTSKRPFDNSLVRQAFVAAIDQTELMGPVREIGEKTHQDQRPATSFVPPETLGRDLYGEVGISYNATRGRELLAQAGYTDASTFPVVRVTDEYGLSTVVADMWKEHLGVRVGNHPLE